MDNNERATTVGQPPIPWKTIIVTQFIIQFAAGVASNLLALLTVIATGIIHKGWPTIAIIGAYLLISLVLWCIAFILGIRYMYGAIMCAMEAFFSAIFRQPGADSPPAGSTGKRAKVQWHDRLLAKLMMSRLLKRLIMPARYRNIKPVTWDRESIRRPVHDRSTVE